MKVTKTNGATSKYTLNINKENKKFSPSSNRIKKVVRTPNRIAGSKGESKKFSLSQQLLIAPFFYHQNIVRNL